MKKITVNKTRILTAAAALVAVFSLAGCGSNAVQEIPRSAETSRSEEATPETAAPEATATPAPHAGAGACCGRAHQRDAGAGGRHPEQRHDLDAACDGPAGGRRR